MNCKQIQTASLKKKTRDGGAVMPYRVALAAIVLAASPSVEPVAPVYASCNPGRTPQLRYYQAGWSRTGASIFEVKADVLEYDPWTYNTSQPSAWVMLFNNTCASRTDCLVQAGWVKYGDGSGNGTGTRKSFIGYTPYGSYTQLEIAPGTTGTFSNYKIYEYYNSSYYSNWADVSVRGTLAWSVPLDFSPNEAVMAGEIGNYATQMPGGWNNPEVFKNAQYVDTAPNSWKNFSGAAYSDDPTQFKSDYESASQLGIWDWKCAT